MATNKQVIILLLGNRTSVFENSRWNMAERVHSHKEMPMLHYSDFSYQFISLTEIGRKDTGV